MTELSFLDEYCLIAKQQIELTQNILGTDCITVILYFEAKLKINIKVNGIPHALHQETMRTQHAHFRIYHMPLVCSGISVYQTKKVDESSAV